MEKPVCPPKPSGSPVPAEVLAYLRDDAAAPALVALDGGGGVDDEPPELARRVDVMPMGGFLETSL